MRCYLAWLPAVCVAWTAGGALAQAIPGGNQAVAVQLPTFSFSTVSTTVSVPDRGSVYLGGIKRASDGRNEFGTPILGKLPYLGPLFKNQGIGSERSVSSFHVSAYIHDFEAMEEALASQPTYGRTIASQETQPRSMIAAYGKTLQPRNPTYGGSLESLLPAGPDNIPTLSVADAQAHRAQQQATRADEALSLFERGQQAEAAGKANVAKLYYQMAARRAGGELRAQVAARLEAMGVTHTGSQVVQGRP